jgi:hypothetical protein
MRALVAAAILGAYALGFAQGRADGHAYAGVSAAALAGLLMGTILAAECFVRWVTWTTGPATEAAAKAAHVEGEI